MGNGEITLRAEEILDEFFGEEQEEYYSEFVEMISSGYGDGSGP